jgi:hypothetical protein
MKVGYPDTINNKAYQGEKSPFKMVDKSKADLDKDGKVSDYEENRAEAAFGSEAPLNYSPLQVREMSDKRRAKKSSRLSKRVDRLDKKLEKSGVKKTKDGNYTGDSRREIRLRKQDRKAGAAAGYGNMDEAKSTAKLDKTLAKKGFKRIDYGGKDDKFDPKTMKPPTRKKKSPVKAVSPARAKLIADNKAAAEKANKAEAAIRESQSSSKSSEPTAEPARKKTRLGRAVGGIRKAIKARKERRNDGENDNPKAKQREIGRITRKTNKKKNKFDIKTQKSLVTKARQDKKTAKAVTRQTERLKKVTKKVGEKVSDVNEGTGLGISKKHPAIGNVVKNIVTAKNKKNKK